MLKITKKQNNQLIGLFVVILIVLIISPYIFSDKSKQEEAPISIETEEIAAINDDGMIDSSGNIILNDNETALIPDTIETSGIVEEAPLTMEELLSSQQIVNTQLKPTHPVQPANTVAATGRYYVRLAALGNKANLDEKIRKLRQNSYPIYTKPNGGVTILMIGPYRSESEAKQNLQRVKQLFNDINDAVVITE